MASEVSSLSLDAFDKRAPWLIDLQERVLVVVTRFQYEAQLLTL